MTPPLTATLVINAGARSGSDALAEATRLLEQGGITVTDAVAGDCDVMTQAIAKAVKANAAMVIVGGGDGSVSSLVDLFVGSETVFALLPLGTANSFARSCGIPLDLSGAIDVIAMGRPEPVDLGRIDEDYFANFASIGLAPEISRSIPHRLKQTFGRFAYALTAADALRRFEGFRLTIDGQSMDGSEVRIANGSYQAGREIVEGAHPQSGEIVLQVVLGRSRWELTRSWVATLLRRPRKDRRVREFHGQCFRVSTVPSLPISIDGEVAAQTPVTVRIVPEAIRMMLPRQTS